ncbi:hypothetical protein SUGI_1048320 [Cryptomeria japonica]|nr:hypothetical protein SUGI_1048320 [Cryptomeria japonica]
MVEWVRVIPLLAYAGSSGLQEGNVNGSHGDGIHNLNSPEIESELGSRLNLDWKSFELKKNGRLISRTRFDRT